MQSVLDDSDPSWAREMDRTGAGVALSRILMPPAHAAIDRMLDRITRCVPALLVEAALFGSVARLQARADSDLDVLLVFDWLPPDREPQASQAEQIAEEVARETGIPLSVWSVSLEDLQAGRRTPMLVDALEDALPICYREAPLPRIDFTPADALHCSGALLERVGEGEEEIGWKLRTGHLPGAAHRARDDLVRLCTALLLLQGMTRPRRAAAVEECVRHNLLPEEIVVRHTAILAWARDSFGADGRDEDAPVPVPPCTPRELQKVLQRLRQEVIERRILLGRWLRPGNPIAGAG